MHKLKNIVISVLLIAVIAVGLSAAVCAQNRSGYIQCTDSYGVFVPAKMPYIEVYAEYTGFFMTTSFQTNVALNYNNVEFLEAAGNISQTFSTAQIVRQPAYATDYFSWSQYCEIFDD